MEAQMVHLLLTKLSFHRNDSDALCQKPKPYHLNFRPSVQTQLPNYTLIHSLSKHTHSHYQHTATCFDT